jgi:hypothetical protein
MVRYFIVNKNDLATICRTAADEGSFEALECLVETYGAPIRASVIISAVYRADMHMVRYAISAGAKLSDKDLVFIGVLVLMQLDRTGDSVFLEMYDFLIPEDMDDVPSIRDRVLREYAESD